LFFLSYINNKCKSQAWWHTSVILASEETEAKGSQVLGQPTLHNEFEARLGNLVRPCLKIEGKRTGDVSTGEEALA
jgi:hypothetical protein